MSRAYPAQIAAAWRAFRGNRPGTLLGPGPGFREAIDAALAVGEAERAAAAAAENTEARAETEKLTRDLAADLFVRLRGGESIASVWDEPIDQTVILEGLKRLAGQDALDAAVRRLAGMPDGR